MHSAQHLKVKHLRRITLHVFLGYFRGIWLDSWVQGLGLQGLGHGFWSLGFIGSLRFGVLIAGLSVLHMACKGLGAIPAHCKPSARNLRALNTPCPNPAIQTPLTTTKPQPKATLNPKPQTPNPGHPKPLTPNPKTQKAVNPKPQTPRPP